MQPCFHVINPLCHHISRPQIELRAKMAIIGRALLVPEDMDDRQHSAMGALPHLFHTQRRLEKLWVEMAALLPPYHLTFIP